ncbi:hypothetical protein KI809_15585 [Geobacter pelophilus]|uniref:Uncharacterized protein n=1 Tax=Geoanaerobacter pelophilus TaxID=60036 RepID=A0AAW4L407_9BACT|nr:hypothetical protein [Geoanaerobacter pelophilus]MBT0665731.1 hypothetical protein [Geoanaerobacter pelophilus]
MLKLSIAQSTLLRVIAAAGTLTGKPDGQQLAWYARGDATVEDRQLMFSAQTAGRPIQALIQKGLVLPYPKLGPYSCIITAAGMKQAELERGKPLTFISPFDQQVLRLRQGEE